MRSRAKLACRAGAALLVAATVTTAASLWTSWAVDGPGVGVARDRNGWSWMAYGDVWLAGSCLAMASLAACLVPAPAPPVGRRVGACSVVACLLLLGLLGAAAVAFLTDLTLFAEFDDPVTPDHDAGEGPVIAAIGLGLGLVGIAIALFPLLPMLGRRG